MLNSSRETTLIFLFPFWIAAKSLLWLQRNETETPPKKTKNKNKTNKQTKKQKTHKTDILNKYTINKRIITFKIDIDSERYTDRQTDRSVCKSYEFAGWQVVSIEPDHLHEDYTISLLGPSIVHKTLAE